MLFGGVRFFVKAVNQERYFSQQAKNTTFFNLVRTSHTTAQFSTSIFCKKKLEKNLKDAGITIEKQEKFGLVGVFFYFVSRIGIVVGLSIALLILIILSQFVFNTQIVGLENISNQEIEQLLNQKISNFCAKKLIDTKSVEDFLLSTNKFSMVSAIIRGNTLVISVKEKTNNPYDNVDNFVPLVSDYDGLITGVDLVSGTLKVEVGQIVKAGEVLVEPYTFNLDGKKRIVKAEAVITARVWYVGQEVHYSHRFEFTRTGKVQNLVNLTFLNLQLTNNNKSCNFSTFDVVKTVTCISNANFLPIYRHKITYYETKQIEIEQPFEQVKDVFLQKAKQKTLLLVEECDIIAKEHCNISTVAGVTFVEYVVEVQKRIDKEK